MPVMRNDETRPRRLVDRGERHTRGRERDERVRARVNNFRPEAERVRAPGLRRLSVMQGILGGWPLSLAQQWPVIREELAARSGAVT